MLKWLQLNRQRLLDGMQNVVPTILDYLVEKEHIDPLGDVYQEIVLDTTVPLQKARKLLDWLSSQPPAVFWAFQHAIRQERLQTEAIHRLAVSEIEMRELMELAEDMSPAEKLSLMGGRSVLKACNELQKYYVARDQLLMSAGLAKGKVMVMDKIQVNICLLPPEEAKTALENPLFSSHQDQERHEYLFSKFPQRQLSLLGLDGVFKAKQEGERSPHKVVASGGAGCGKSVCFTRKAPYEWAFGRLWQHFALLFCLELRDKSVWKAKTLSELLKLAELGLSAVEQEEVVQFITSHPDQVVIVCDGLDESSIDPNSLLWHVLQGTAIGVPSRLHIVVTTRPCNAAVELTQSTSYRGVEVIGFAEEDVALFARKYLGIETGKKLLSLLHKQPSIASMMHAPLFCLMVCDLFQKENDLPSRRTDVFQKIVVALLHRFARARNVQVPFQDWTDAPASLKELVIGLGKVAFLGLQNKQLYFTDQELTNAGMPLEALELGLPTRSESTSLWKQDEYAFSHLTLQEFLAALYVSSEVLQTDEDMAKLLETVRFEDGHLSSFWVFLAGLLDSHLVDVLLHRVLSVPATQSGLIGPDRLLQACRCYAESHLGQSSVPSASINTFLGKGSLSFVANFLSVSDCAAISTVLQAHTQTEHLHIVNFGNCHVTDTRLAGLLTGLQRCKSYKKFLMSRNSLSSQEMADLSIVLANSASTLEVLHVDFNHIGEEGLETLGTALKQCKALKSLHLAGNAPAPQTLFDLLSRLPDLEKFSVSGLGDDGVERLAGGVQSCTRLQKLDISSMALSSQSVPILQRLLSSRPSLTLWAREGDFSEDAWKELNHAVGAHRIKKL